MKEKIPIDRITVIGLVAICLQVIFTINGIKFFPFSSHGIFEIYRKIEGQKFYRYMTTDSQPSLEEEGIQYEYHFKIMKLLLQEVPPNEIPRYFDKEIIGIKEIEFGKSNVTPLFTEKWIYKK